MLSDTEAHVLETIARHYDACCGHLQAGSYMEMCANIATAAKWPLDTIDVAHILFSLAARPSPLTLIECHGTARVTLSLDYLSRYVPHAMVGTADVGSGMTTGDGGVDWTIQ